MNAILSGVIAGAIGGVAGGAIVWLIEKASGKKPKAAPFITAICVVGAVTASRSLHPSPQAEALSALDKLPTIQAIKTYYPDDYATLQTKVSAIDSSASTVETQNAIRPVLSDLVARQMPKANAESVYDAMDLAREEAKTLRDIDPASCVGMLTDGTANVDMGKVLTPAQAQRDQAVTSQLLIQAATAPSSPPAPLQAEQMQALVIRALASLPPDERTAVATMLQKSAKPASAPEFRAMCDFNLAVFDAILAQPKGTGGSMMRSLIATK